MSKKEERQISRQELADYLAALSRQLRSGQMEVEGELLPVPDAVGLKFHLKEEEGAIVAKLSWRWPPRGSLTRVAVAATPPPPASFKAVKTRLASCFKDLQRVLGQGLFPEAQAMSDFVARAQAFAALAEPAWRQPLTQFMLHLENLQRAGDNRQLDAMQQALQELADCMVACHRDFK